MPALVFGATVFTAGVKLEMNSEITFSCKILRGLVVETTSRCDVLLKKKYAFGCSFPCFKTIVSTYKETVSLMQWKVSTTQGVALSPKTNLPLTRTQV